MQQYYLYIMTSPSGIFYAGTTNDLKRRVYEHELSLGMTCRR